MISSRPCNHYLSRVFLVAAMLGTISARADEPAKQSRPSYTMPNTEVFDMTAKDDGQVYRIFISAPTLTAPKDGFSVLYVLDGNAFFPGFAGERRLEEFEKQAGGPIIVVGVGYPTDKAYDTQRRLYDLTSTLGNADANRNSTASVRTGGNEHFAQFLLDQLRPEIEKSYFVNKKKESLFGHSLGGLFALHILYTRPTTFDAIIAASPSQWWNDQAILSEERAFTKALNDGKIKQPISRLLLLTGERDSTATITWDAEALSRRLDRLSINGLRVRFIMLDGETHITVPYRAVTPTLRFVMAVP